MEMERMHKSMSPTSLGKVLMQHGRSTTPGLLQGMVLNYPRGKSPRVERKFDKIKALKTMDEPKKTPKVTATSDDEPPKAVPQKEEKGESEKQEKGKVEVPEQTSPNTQSPKLRDVAANPPLSRVGSDDQSDFTFVPRVYKTLRRKVIKEAAMREMGSVDTLLNRHGYIEESLRNQKVPNSIRLSKLSKI